jgi:hypothetical protein
MTLRKAHRIAMRESGLDKMIKVCYTISTNAKGGKANDKAKIR